MITLFNLEKTIFAVEHDKEFGSADSEKLCWLFSGAKQLATNSIEGTFIGPRREMITPWSTNAVEITQNMGLEGIRRIEEFFISNEENPTFDKMLLRLYHKIDSSVFKVDLEPEKIKHVDNLHAYNKEEGLALSEDEIAYLESVEKKIGRPLTDSEIFGFSQVNSEHCRHKIFGGEFIIDGEKRESSLFKLIKKTTATHQGKVVSAYKDNCAFIDGPKAKQFAPARHDTSDYFEITDFDSVLSLKAETHNFPTTVEPFNGAATGTGGEIRDRIGGGKGAFPVSGTAVYMTSYPRLDSSHSWEKEMEARPWLYQTPRQILIKASNGASDFGNKFGQPLICGSLYTFEHSENGKQYGFDKVIMLAGGIGYGKKEDCMKDTPKAGDKIVLLGGDNYRIGMGGGAVSSVNTGEYKGAIELNAIQRSNPEMQKRAYNAIRAIAEELHTPIISIHDHGAGGHLNCLSELVEETGGTIYMDQLPIGDPTLSAKEIVGNESQERMGLVVHAEDLEYLRKIAERERCPFYVVGECTGDMQFTFVDRNKDEKPIDLQLADMFGNTPMTTMTDRTVVENFAEPEYSQAQLPKYITDVLSLEAVACKDWLTNKVDRSVTGKIAMQQTAGTIQLPVNDCGVIALDYTGTSGMANSLGHAPAIALADSAKGTVMAMSEALLNLVFAPIAGGLDAVSMSANWMWPCRNEGEDSRLYKAVQAASDFAIALGINIPTGKDSLSMTQKYGDRKVLSPGTVIITAAGEVTDVKKCVKAALKDTESQLVYVDFSADDRLRLGGSAFAQTLSAVGSDVPTVCNADYFRRAWTAVQDLIHNGQVLAGHDISAGGLVTALLEMCFPCKNIGLDVDLNPLREADPVKALMSERPAVLLQVTNADEIVWKLSEAGVFTVKIATLNRSRKMNIHWCCSDTLTLDIDSMRDIWMKTSYLLDCDQSTPALALERFNNYKKQPLEFNFKHDFFGTMQSYGINPARREKSGTRAAIIREKGSNGDREMAWSLYLAGFDVKDVMMTDLICGRETLDDVNLIVFVGGFSNSDVLNSAKGWAGAFKYNPAAASALSRFYSRPDTLSLGICNGCQLMVELGLITPEHEQKPRMCHNKSHKFESLFVSLDIKPSNSVMLGSMQGETLGVWIAHGEGRFSLPYDEYRYNIPAKYTYAEYPGNPNGSDFSAAAICSADGRHLAMMPHPERAIHPWNWAYYPENRQSDEVSPWIEMFTNALDWIRKH